MDRFANCAQPFGVSFLLLFLRSRVSYFVSVSFFYFCLFVVCVVVDVDVCLCTVFSNWLKNTCLSSATALRPFHSIHTAVHRTPHTLFFFFIFSRLENQLLPFGMLHCSTIHRATRRRIRKTELKERKKKQIDQKYVRLFLLPQPPRSSTASTAGCVWVCFVVNRTLEINRLLAARQIFTQARFSIYAKLKKK